MYRNVLSLRYYKLDSRLLCVQMTCRKVDAGKVDWCAHYSMYSKTNYTTCQGFGSLSDSKQIIRTEHTDHVPDDFTLNRKLLAKWLTCHCFGYNSISI